MRINLVSLSALMGGCLLLAGCGTTWQKPGARPGEFEATQKRCEAAAYREFPPRMRMVEIRPGYYKPYKTKCRPTPKGEVCTQTGGEWVPPSTYRKDDNESARDAQVDDCLYSHGWRPVKN